MYQFIGIDIGTLSTKGLLICQDGDIICQTSIEHKINSPKPSWLEQNADEIWWAETVEVIRRLLNHPKAKPSNIGGIGISGLFPALLIADKNGTPLRPAILYSDMRATKELNDFNRTFQANLNSDSVTPKIAWLRKNEPSIFKKTRYLFSSHNYIVFRLTGKYCLDFKVADSYGCLLDLNTLKWDEETAAWAGIKIDQLPNLLSVTDIAGYVTKEAAQITGLLPGTPVICGSGDSLIIHFAVGVIKQGEGLLSFGTTGWISILPFDLVNYLNCPSLTSQGAPYQLCGYLASLGSLLQWYLDTFASHEMETAARVNKSVFDFLDEKAKKIPVGADGLILLPYFLDRIETSVIPTRSGAILGLKLFHTSSHFYRALMESFGFVIYQAIEQVEKKGLPIKRIVSTGGGARSKLWRQIVSDITGKHIYYYKNINPCLGSAYLVGYALGLWDTLDEIFDWLPQQSITKPNQRNFLKYKMTYKSFLDAQEKLFKSITSDKYL